MKLLYGTANTAKIQHMREMLQGSGIEIIGLNDINLKVESIDESGNNPLENARIKALAYYKVLKTPVFSCDSGLYIEGIDSKSQPGVHVRRVNGKVLDDEEMIEHYISVALNHGGEVKAKYKNAICLILDEENIFEYDGADISSDSFIITSKPHPMRNIGFPLDSISIEMETGRYFMDITLQDNSKSKMSQGFKEFFLRAATK
ncbi:non-canonical purine NTP pyrophosphatase [Clostridium sp.]|uniref:non-canonical purine NTP pyrophosphatase n=1 Tax=Clostridium sp. TaxID=1506 RepID=UPI002FC70604